MTRVPAPVTNHRSPTGVGLPSEDPPIELRHYLRVLRRRRLLVIVTVLVAMIGAFLITPRAALYTAEARLYVGDRGIDIDPTSLELSNDRFAGLSFLASSYATMLTTRTAAEQALAESGVGLTVDEALAAIDAFAEPASLLITIRVVDKDPAVAKALADGLADSFVTLLRDQQEALALPDDRDAPPPLSVFEYAVLPTTPEPSPLFRNLILASMFGLLLAVGFVVLLEYMDLTIRSAEDAQHRLQLTVLGAIPLDSRLVRG